jgi:hypothetical protein
LACHLVQWNIGTLVALAFNKNEFALNFWVLARY